MALIGQIRKNSWILVVMIALGLGGFILMDMTSGQQSVFGSGQGTMAEIDGNAVDINEFTTTEQIVYGGQSGDTYAQRNAIWDYYLDNFIVREEAAKIGVGVSKDELIDLQFGTNLSPIINSRFRDPATGVVDRQILASYQQAIQNNTLNPDLRMFWAHQENEIINERLKTKMSEMAMAAMYIPTWQAEMLSANANSKVDFLYVKIPFTSVEDGSISLTDADFNKYLEEHANTYHQDEETRKISYVSFDVIPTAEDSAAVRSAMAEMIPTFQSTPDNEVYVQSQFGVYDKSYYTAEQMAGSEIADTFFTLPIGSVYGPYEESGQYYLAKVVNRKVIPDSVRSRHILISVSDVNNQLLLAQAISTVDSLKGLIEGGTHSFDSLALAFGSDGTATKGGDLGFTAIGGMVKPFNDLIFYEAEENELNTVVTQFGAHLVEVTDRKYIENKEGVQMAYVFDAIVPGDETIKAVENEALNFLDTNGSLEEMEAAIAAQSDLELVTTNSLNENDYSIGNLGSGQTSRDIIRWSFGHDPNIGKINVGDVSPDLYRYQDQREYFTNKYVIAALHSIRPAGNAKLEDVRDEIEPAVLNAKKAEMVAQAVAGNTDLAAIASQYGVTVDTATSVPFSTSFASGLGTEPKVIGKAFSLNLDETSEAFQGNGGIFVLKTIAKTGGEAGTNLQQVRASALQNVRTQIQGGMVRSLKDKANVSDKRSRFF